MTYDPTDWPSEGFDNDENEWHVIEDREVIAVTDEAVLIVDSDGDNDMWIPRSVLQDGHSILPGCKELAVQRWFAEKEGL